MSCQTKLVATTYGEQHLMTVGDFVMQNPTASTARKLLGSCCLSIQLAG